MKRRPSTYVVEFVVDGQRRTLLVDCVGILAACREVRARFPNAKQLEVKKWGCTKSDSDSAMDK